MSLLDTLKSWWNTVKTSVKNLWNSVTWSWDTYTTAVSNDTNQDTGKETLNQQIANWNINKPTQNQTTTTVSGFDTLRENINQNNDVPKQVSAPTVIEDKDEENFWDKVGNWFKWASKDIVDTTEWVNNWANWLINSRKAKADYNSKEEMYAVWYDEGNKNVYYLDLNESRWLFDNDWKTEAWSKDRFEQLLNEALLKANQPWNTQQDVVNTWMDFYNNAKWLFRIRADDRYTDWLFWATPYWRRKDMYTDDELDYLASTWKTQKWSYVPTFDEFQDYVSMYLRNQQTQQDLWMAYQTPDAIEEIKLNAGYESDWMSKQRDIALKWISEYLDPMRTVNPNAATTEELRYAAQVLPDQLWRWYNRVSPVYKAEREIMWRDSSTWSTWDKALLEYAKQLHQLDWIFANNLNEVFRQNLLYWTNKKGEVVNTIDVFENGESLNDVLTKWMRDIIWGEEKRYNEHQSPLDIAENLANEALYFYKQDKDWPLKQAWNKLEYFFEPVGATLWEAWQAVWAWGMDLLKWLSLWTISDDLTKSYMDQDATVFRLLETDDWAIWRNVKKYYLDITEYTPELIWNLAPDIALFMTTGPWALTTALSWAKNLSRTTKIIRAAEWASLWNKLKAFLRWTDYIGAGRKLWMSEELLKSIINPTKVANSWKYYQTLKTWAQLVDRALTQTWLWQFMDAQWSAYDTEPYSETSFWMSVIWSAVFDIFPDLFRLSTWKGWFQTLTGQKWNIWSLANYIDSSPEAAEAIARALWKWTWEIWVDELKSFVKNFWAVEDAAKQAYNLLSPAEKEAIWKMTKTMMYNFVTQAFGSNSTIGKSVRRILANGSTNIADVIKYLWRIPGDITMGPYTSTIKLKNWTRALVSAPNEYNVALDTIYTKWFSDRIQNWFSQADLDKLSKLDWYSDVNANKDKWFNAVTDDKTWTTYYLNEEWLRHFWLNAESMTLESLWVTLAQAENAREALNKIKWAKWVNISDNAIDDIADTWWYMEIVDKVKEVLWC